MRWSGQVPDLVVQLDRDGAAPLGHQLQEALREAVRSGQVGAGDRLPSTRALADRLRLSRGLVVECYEQLTAEGYLVSARGSGTRVAAAAASGAATAVAAAQAPTVAGPWTVSFEYGIPDLGSFPMRDWSWALGQAARRLPTADLGDETDGGSEHLRAVLAGYHRRVRAGAAAPADVLVSNGFRHGLNVALGALARRGHDRLALEDPGPREHAEIAARAGLVPVPVPVTADGLDVEALARSGARAALLTPAHQCPTGVALGARRRHDLVAWAREVDGVLLEDDYDAEFRYDRQPVGSLQGLAPDRVVAIGSVSKTLAPGLRIGWLLAPPWLADDLRHERHLSSRGVPALDQLALALLIETGRFDRHLRRMRETYTARRTVLVTELARHAPGVRLRGLEAGCHLLAELPDHCDEGRVVADLAGRGVLVAGLGHYRQGPATGDFGGPALVLGFGNASETQLREGARAIGAVVGGARLSTQVPP